MINDSSWYSKLSMYADNYLLPQQWTSSNPLPSSPPALNRFTLKDFSLAWNLDQVCTMWTFRNIRHSLLWGRVVYSYHWFNVEIRLGLKLHLFLLPYRLEGLGLKVIVGMFTGCLFSPLNHRSDHVCYLHYMPVFSSVLTSLLTWVPTSVLTRDIELTSYMTTYSVKIHIS